jgi:predicted aldo/keto reductase-like oxidoreductase
MSDQAVSRRDFLRTSAATAAVAAAGTAHAEEANKTSAGPLPKRKLGRSGIEVTMLGQGGAQDLNMRHLNLMTEMGVRYIDTADCYGDGQSEKQIGEWLKTVDRKDYFIVDKDHPRSADQWVEMLDPRLEMMSSDYVDAYFLHCFGDEEYHKTNFREWPESKEWAKAAEKIKKSGKARLVGFSTHCQPVELRIELLEAAARGGWVDMIMVANNPSVIKKNARFNKALDACYEAGIGLISMKETYTGHKTISEVVPEFEAMGLTPHAAVLSATWTDGRFACIISHMANAKHLRENATTARNFKPLTKEQHGAVIQFLDKHNRAYCAACTGDCRKAAGTAADLNTIARYVAYYEILGKRAEARELFAKLPPEQRDLDGIDVEAASHGCCSNLDFAHIVKVARHHLA